MPQINKSNSNVLKMFFGYKLNEFDSPIYSHLLRWNNTSRINNYLSDEFKDSLDNYNPIEDYQYKLNGKLEGFDYLPLPEDVKGVLRF